MFFYFSLCFFNINAFFIESCWEGWRSPSRQRGSSPPSAHRVLPALQRLLLPSQNIPAVAWGRRGAVWGDEGTRHQNKLQGSAEDQKKQVYRQLKLSTGPQLQQPWEWYKGRAHLGPPPAGVV